MRTFFSVGGEHSTDTLPPFLAAWHADPFVLGAILLAATLYLVGWARLHQRSSNKSVISTWRRWSYLGGLVVVLAATVSPISTYAEVRFSMHMVQHMLLLLVAPPLLLLGTPVIPMMWALPITMRKRVGRVLSSRHALHHVGRWLVHPVVTVTLYTVTIALWHVPVLFEVAQGRTLLHDTQHAMFLFTAVLYWWPIVHPSGRARSMSYAAALPYLLPPFLEGMLLGALITLSSEPLYETYVSMPSIWGLSTLEDQQLAGLIMWVPGGMLFLIPLFWLLMLALRSEEQRERQRSTNRRTREKRSL